MFTQLGRAPGPTRTFQQSYSRSSGLPSVLDHLLEVPAADSALLSSPSRRYSLDSGPRSPQLQSLESHLPSLYC